MEPATLLFSLLSQAPDVVALLGAAGGGVVRAFPVLAPQGTPRPFLTYQLISRVPADGDSAICRLGDVARVQLSLFTGTYDELGPLTAAVQAALGYAEPAPGVYLERDNVIDQPPIAGGLGYHRTVDYTVTLP